MANIELNQDLKQILEILKNAGKAVKLRDIREALQNPISDRTLLRRLSTLIGMGEITSRGQKKGTTYIFKDIKDLLPLSEASKALKAQVQLPLQQRRPVPYIPAFLYDYQPNETFYLSKSVREHLKLVGQQFNHELVPGTYVKRILHRLLIDLSWNSSRLEGNTYSLLETEHLLEFGAEAENKNIIEARMILNHKNAIEFMVKSIDMLGFNKQTVLSIHAFLSDGLLANPEARGQLRQIPVGIGRTVYHPPEIPQLIDECFQRILDSADKIVDPFEQSFFAMVHLPYLQPFEDVNKRVSRLVSNIPLIKHNLSPLSFVDVPKNDDVSGLLAIYELNKIELMRDVFVWAYERSAQQYQLVYNTIVEPNIIEMRHKNSLFTLINVIISQDIRGEKIIHTIQEWSNENIPADDVSEFIRIAEKEIISLHEGNIAIYDVDLEVFKKWKVS